MGLVPLLGGSPYGSAPSVGVLTPPPPHAPPEVAVPQEEGGAAVDERQCALCLQCGDAPSQVTAAPMGAPRGGGGGAVGVTWVAFVRVPEGLLGVPWMSLGVPWMSLGATWGALGVPRGSLGCHWVSPRDPLGVIWVSLGATWGALGVPQGSLGCHLGGIGCH